MSFLATPRTIFWVDQICINQADLGEKSEQVAMMDRIFTSSQQMVAWLGKGFPEFTRDALAYAERLSKRIERRRRQGKHEKMLPSNYDLYAWVQLVQFLENPWFGRVWVMQEVIMAPTVMGQDGLQKAAIRLMLKDCAIDFDRLARVMRAIDANNFTEDLVLESGATARRSPQGFRAIEVFSSYREARSSGVPVSIFDAISDAWAFKASNARDKLYAVNGFADAPADLVLSLDYKRPVDDVYIEYASRLVKKHPSLLSMAGIGGKRSRMTIPSWVPDFSYPSLTNVTPKQRPLELYQACGRFNDSLIEFDTATNTLQLQTIQIDSVGKVFEQPKKSEQPTKRWDDTSSKNKRHCRAMLRWLKDIEDYLAVSRIPAAGSAYDSERILVQTITGRYSQNTPTIEHEFSQAYHTWYRGLRNQAGYRDVAAFIKRALAGCPGVRVDIDRPRVMEFASGERPLLATAERSLLGFGPLMTQPGDVVCIASGVSLPLLLRADDTGNVQGGIAAPKRWKLVGCCFVHGLMYGEGLQVGEPRACIIT